MTTKRLETDLYPPIKTMLEQQGFVVKGEIKQCDVMALRDEQMLVVELKTTLNLTLILQAVERLALTEFVYIAVPADCAPLKKQQKSIVKLLGNPIVSTSIHDDDEVIEYSTDPELIYEKYKDLVDIVIDGGYGELQASTVVDYTSDEPIILRQGKGDLESYL